MEKEEKEKRVSGFDYANTIFCMKRPYSSSVETVHKPKSKSEHFDLVKLAKDKKMYLWYASKTAPHQLLLDFDSVPDLPYSKLEQQLPKVQNGYVCPVCGKGMSSKSGYTLHLKQKHANDN